MSERCVVRKGIFGRWIIFHPSIRTIDASTIIKAWSGSKWVPCSYDGTPYDVQVSNFASEREAREYCRENGLEPLGA